MQIANSNLTLFDYITNSNKADSALQDAAVRQKFDVASDIRNLQQDIISGDIDTTLTQLQSGESSLNLQTLDNMLNFNLLSVGKDLQQVVRDLGISKEIEIKQINGQWQVQQTSQDKPLNQLQSYLERNDKLQKQLDTMNKLSELVELGASQQYAKQLQKADISEPDVVTYLTQAREYLFSIDSFSLSSKHLSLGSRGEAENFFAEVKQTLGLSDDNK
ncbi:hypothetical protein [Paraglaciecola sp. 25GB23A]|uniref:hypothetical protein n=1 Tax=Paraglaciecola sp. 25GB23A TaxID=3156068 RepID=UPI0032AF7005